MRTILHIAAGLGCATALACQQSKSASPPAAAPPAAPSSFTPTNDPTPSAPAPAPVPSGFLTARDLAAPSNLTAESPSDIINDINGLTEFFATSPSAGPGSGCLAQVLGRHQAKADASGNFTIDIVEGDLTSCMQGDPGTAVAGGHFTSYSLRIQVIAQCPGQDLTKMDGRSFSELMRSRLQPFPCTAVLTNTQVAWTAAMDAGGIRSMKLNAGFTGPLSTPSSGSALADPGVGGCAVTSDGSSETYDGCVYSEAVTFGAVPATYPNNIFVQVTDQQLVRGGLAPYYRSGAKAFVYNGWNGTMTYSGDKAAPTWTARGPSGVSSGGTFGSVANGGASNAANPATAAANTQAGHLPLVDPSGSGLLGHAAMQLGRTLGHGRSPALPPHP